MAGGYFFTFRILVTKLIPGVFFLWVVRWHVFGPVFARHWWSGRGGGVSDAGSVAA